MDPAAVIPLFLEGQAYDACLVQHNNVNTYCLVKSVKSSIFDKMTIALWGRKQNN